MIIGKDFFYGNRAIAQLTETSVETALNNLIAQYEPELLNCFLGTQLYVDLKAALVADPTLEQPENEHFNKLVFGTAYTNKYGNPANWVGLSYGVGTNKKSLLADYIYFFWLRMNVSTATGTGEKVVQAENSTTADVFPKQVEAWNSGVRQAKELRSFLQADPVVWVNYADPLTPPIYNHCRDYFLTINPILG